MNTGALDVSDMTLQTKPRLSTAIALGALFTVTLLLCTRAFLRAEQVAAD